MCICTRIHVTTDTSGIRLWWCVVCAEADDCQKRHSNTARDIPPQGGHVLQTGGQVEDETFYMFPVPTH